MPGYRQGEILSHLLLFARQLKAKGLKITPDGVADAARSLAFIDLSFRQDFYSALKANFVSSPQDLAAFNALFERFWSRIQKEERQESPLPNAGEQEDGEACGDESPSGSQEVEYVSEENGVDEQELRSGYSPEEVLVGKDFSRFFPEEEGILEREFARILSRLATRVSRRRKPAARGREMDFRRSLKRAVRHGGEMVELVRRKRKIKPLKVMVICDVSGSMDASTRFMLRFLFGMKKVLDQSEFFVFSTRLTRITDILQPNRWTQALTDISRRVQDWSGGTQIGHCLQVFNERYARRMAARSSVVILISDGWDRGEAELLDAEMRRLKRRARRLIWLNPLLGTLEYQPLCLGMRTALPYVDFFLPANTLRGLRTLGDVLADLDKRVSV
ncbi:MAG: VWA domain-containing protein [Pseudomonadota bacterium]